MKHHENTFLLTIFVVVIISANISAQPYFQGIENEYTVNLERFNLKHDPKKKRYWFNEKVRARANNNQPLKTVSVSEIKITERQFDSLYKIAKQELPAYNGNPTGITGLLIHYGLTEDYEMQLFFSPWVMDIDYVDDGSEYIIGSVKDFNKSEFWVIKDGKLKSISRDDQLVKQSLSRFKRHIKIKDKSGDFENNDFSFDDWRSDSKCAFMNFQQIRRIFTSKSVSKDENGEKFLISYEGLVLKRFQIHAVKKTIISFRKLRNKVTSLFVTQAQKAMLDQFALDNRELKKGDKEEIYEANLSGLCPPGCDKFKYPLSIQ